MLRTLIYHEIMNTLLRRQPLQMAEALDAGRNFLLLYDAECGLCQWTQRWIDAHDPAGLVDARPLQTPGLLGRLSISEEDALREIHVISRSGELRIGADAVLWLVSQLPGYHWLAALNRSRAVGKIARLIYRQIAKRRARHDCPEGKCHF